MPSSHAWIPRGSGRGTFAGLGPGTLYKYRVSARDGSSQDKCDPYAFHAEVPPRTASVVWDLEYRWSDAPWVQQRAQANSLNAPWSIYELHIGSWRRVVEDGNRFLNYRELAHAVADYVTQLGFTHVELLPVMEHPFYGSWGYQVTGYFAPSARYGTPQDFMYFVDHLHSRGIGVILDWVPSHFPTDAFGLSRFDGTHLYEHEDPRQGFHPEWSSSIFNYGRAEVRNFLISNALFWLDRYHIDALRVDAVASLLYLDYGRRAGEWIPNRFGGHENLEAVEFVRQLNLAVYRDHPDTQTIAEESTAWPLVSRPTYLGGLGFGLKWNMGWMHDTPALLPAGSGEPQFHHSRLTFSICTRSPRTSCCRCPTMKWCTARARSSARCPVMSGNSSPTCACCWATCGGIRARSCCSWAGSSASGASGSTRRAWSGTCLSTRCTRACSAGYAT